MKSLRFILPLVVFVVLLIFLLIGLQLNPREVPSPLIGKPAPAFQLSRLDDPLKTVSQADMRGQVWLLNVWASWCVACMEEHPMLVELSRGGVVPIYGLNWKDTRPAALGWLGKNGNPYTLSIADPDGKVGIDYGVYGVPETYVIDKEGVIRLKVIGSVAQGKDGKVLELPREIQETRLNKMVLPCVKLLQQATAPRACES